MMERRRVLGALQLGSAIVGADILQKVRWQFRVERPGSAAPVT